MATVSRLRAHRITQALTSHNDVRLDESQPIYLAVWPGRLYPTPIILA